MHIFLNRKKIFPVLFVKKLSSMLWSNALPFQICFFPKIFEQVFMHISEINKLPELSFEFEILFIEENLPLEKFLKNI